MALPVTKINAGDAKPGTTLRLNTGTWIVKDTTKTRHSIVLDLESYFADIRATKTQRVFKNTDVLDSIPHPARWAEY